MAEQQLRPIFISDFNIPFLQGMNLNQCATKDSLIVYLHYMKPCHSLIEGNCSENIQLNLSKYNFSEIAAFPKRYLVIAGHYVQYSKLTYLPFVEHVLDLT